MVAGGGVCCDGGLVLVRLVLLDVAVEVGLLAEAAVALLALERLLLVVDIPHVALQVRADRERAVAVLALNTPIDYWRRQTQMCPNPCVRLALMQ